MKLFFVLLILFVSIESRAQFPEIEVYGNHALEDETIIRMSDLRFNPNLSELEIKRKLETTSLFSKVTVRRTGNLVKIIVREKTSWFVLPYYYSDANLAIYGLAGGLSDLFGQDAYMVGRYQTGTQNHIGSVAYRDEFFQNSLMIFGLVFEYENALHDIYQGRNVVQRTANKFTGYNFQLGRHLSHKIDIELDTHYETHSFEELNSSFRHGIQFSQRLLADFGNYYLNEGLARGNAIRLYVEYTLPGSNFQFIQYGYSGSKSVVLDGDFNWIIHSKAEFGAPLPRYQLFELGAGRLRGFSAETFRDNGYVLMQNDFLLTSWSFFKIKARPMLFTDMAYVEQALRPAIGAGFQIFFPKVVVPAMQIYGGYGFHPNGFSIIAAIGPQF